MKVSAFTYCRYTWLLVLAIMIPMVAALLGSFIFQPYWGPLTRLGGYLEDDYGWNTPQEEFKKPLFTNARSLKDYDHYYDVVVVGDSFSDDERKGWQNYFVKQTGLSVITFQQTIGTDKVINSETFQSSPPHYLVYESLEQFSLPRLAQLTSIKPLAKVLKTNQQGKADDTVSLKTATPFLVTRDVTPPMGRSRFPSREARIDETMDHLRKKFLRSIFNTPSTKELKSLWGSNLQSTSYLLPLRSNSERLFSSKQTNAMLVYSLDIAKTTDDFSVKKAARGAWQLRRAVEANGRTKVIVMLFPDKLTIYKPYLADPSVAPPSIIPRMAQDFPYLLRLDTVFSRAVAEGTQDLYLPDDSHCGYKGYTLAAEQLAQSINGSKVHPIASANR